MSVSSPRSAALDAPAPASQARGPRARMRRALLDAATELASRGLVPSVSDVAQGAQVSRATAYRYFPSQSALVQAIVSEALGPILEWDTASRDAEERIGRLFRFGYLRMVRYEAPLRAALRLALDQWARHRAGTLGSEPRIVRGNRIRVLRHALGPLASELPKRSFDRLVQSLAVVFGTEAMVVLKDMCHLGDAQIAQVAEWMARALVHATLAGEGRRGSSGAKRYADRRVAARRTDAPKRNGGIARARS